MRDKKLGLKVTEEELTQVIPKDWIGGSVSRDTAYEIAYALREYIEKRVSKGRGLGNEPFSPNVYSKSYQESQEFKAYGKKPRPVNMRLTGDMLRAIDVGVSSDGLPMLSINDENAPKAHGHQTGQYGEGPLPVRPFFGVTKDEFEKVARKFRSLIEQETAEKNKEVQRSFSDDTARLPSPKDALKVLGELQSLKKLVKLIK